MDDYTQEANHRRAKYPYEYRAPYEGIPKGVEGNFVWVPFQKEGYVLFLFDDEEDRDRLAARYETQEQVA
jgi:hypothetical protein